MKRLKLNIQLFGASNSNSTTLTNKLGDKATLAVSFNETSVNTSGNYSNLTVSASITMHTGSFSQISSPYLEVYWFDRVQWKDVLIASKNVTAISKGQTISVSGNCTQYHFNDGKVSGYAWARWTHSSSSSYVPAKGTVGTPETNLTNIARGFSSTPTLAYVSKTETSLTFKWTTSEARDYTQYKIDGGSWKDADDTVASDNKSGTFTISGLSANSSHSVQVQVRKKDSQLWASTNTLSNQQTYDYPKITTVNSTALNIGSEQTLTISNPLGRTYKIYMYKDSMSGTKLYESGNLTTNGNVKFTPTASTLYASIPSAKSGKCVYRVTYGSVNKDTTGSYTYNCVEANCTPTISAKTAKDTTNKTLTGDENKLIINLSKPTVSMTASAKNSAKISSYKNDKYYVGIT